MQSRSRPMLGHRGTGYATPRRSTLTQTWNFYILRVAAALRARPTCLRIDLNQVFSQKLKCYPRKECSRHHQTCARSRNASCVVHSMSTVPRLQLHNPRHQHPSRTLPCQDLSLLEIELLHLPHSRFKTGEDRDTCRRLLEELLDASPEYLTGELVKNW